MNTEPHRTGTPPHKSQGGPGREETAEERADRLWGEMLQEVRVCQTGAQILFGFLLSVAFTPRFGSLGGFDRSLYVVTVILGACEEDRGLLGSAWGADGTLARVLYQPAGGTRQPASAESVAAKAVLKPGATLSRLPLSASARPARASSRSATGWLSPGRSMPAMAWLSCQARYRKASWRRCTTLTSATKLPSRWER